MPSPTASGATIHAHGAALRTVRAAALPLIALSVLSAASATPPATASVDMLASLGANSARLLSALGFKSSAARRTLLAHRLRGGEMVSTRMQTPQPCSPHSSTRAERLSPLYSSEYRASELRAHKSTVTFEPPTGKAAQPLTPLSDTVAELKRQQHELTASPLKTFSSPTTLRAAPDGPGGAHELDLATPASEAGNTINRAFASLASAAATPYKLAATPARGWPKRFRAELETLKSAMSTYSASQKQAMQDLEQEKKRAAALEQQNAALEAAMRARLAEMDRVKTTMEARTRETEARLQALKGDAAAKESQDEEVSQQLQTLEKAKTALQARAARAAEDMDVLRQQLGAAQAQCAQLSDEKKALHAKAAEVPPLQQHLRRVTAAKEESEQALTRMGAQHRRVLTQMQASAAEVESLKGALETQQRARVQLDKDVAALSKEKSSLIEQLRAADRSGRVAKEEGQQLVREWQKRHDSLERVLREKAAAAAGVEQQAKALRQKLEAADGKHAKSAAQLKAMTDMKQALEAQVEQLRELDARRQQENSQVKAALEMLQAEMRESQTEMTQLRADLAKALAGRDTIEQELAQLSAAHAEDRAAEAVAADAKLEALEDRRQAAAAEAAALQQQLTSLETDYAAASSLLKTAQESLAEQQREKEALAQTVRDLQQSNARLSCQGQEAAKVLQQVRGELREAKEDAAAKGAAAEAGEKRAASLEHELQRLNRHVESVEQVKRVLRHEAATTQQEMKQLRAQLAHRTHMLQVGQRSEDEKAKQLAALEEVAQTLEHKLQHAQSQAAELTQQISAGEREVEALRASLKKECDSNEVLAAELSRIQLSISAQVQASRDAANEWKLRYDGLHSDMEQAQQQLAGVRGVTRERDALVRHVSQLQDDLATMQRERAAAERTEARLQDQLRQAEALAADLRAQECAAVEAAAAAEARAEAVAGNNTALQAQLQDTEATALARQRELAEVSHKLEGLTVVKDALDRQMQVMKAEAVQLRTQLRAKEAAATSSAAELEDLRHRLGVLDGVRETLEGRLQAAEAAAAQTTSEKDQLVALLHEGRTLLEQEQAAHKEAQQQLQAERAGAVETREQVAALQEEAGRQQSDIDALARRNTELVGVRASLARRLKVAEEHLAQARTQNEQLMASMAAERATRERAERETDDARRAAASRTQTITLMRREMEHANNVTQQQWNLLDAARVHLSEVMAAKEALEATHAQAALSPGRLGPRAASGDCSVAMTPRLAKRLVGPGQTGSVEGFVHAAADVEGFVSHLAAVCDSPRTARTPLPAFTPTRSKADAPGHTVDTAVRAGARERADLEVKLQRVTLEKERLEEEARRQHADLARLRGVLLQAPPTLSPVADNFFD